MSWKKNPIFVTNQTTFLSLWCLVSGELPNQHISFLHFPSIFAGCRMPSQDVRNSMHACE